MLSIKLSENDGKAPEAVPYMPAGISEISCTVNGAAGKRTVLADAAAVDRLNTDLKKKQTAAENHEHARPVILFDHQAGAAAAVPLGFEWDDKRGILLRVEWTQAGREAVEGGNYGYISPAFMLVEGDSLIRGLQDGVEVGSLVNDPAFERNECIAAGRVAAEAVQVFSASVLPPFENVEKNTCISNYGFPSVWESKRCSSKRNKINFFIS
jgi:phage I-like protein